MFILLAIKMIRVLLLKDPNNKLLTEIAQSNSLAVFYSNFPC